MSCKNCPQCQGDQVSDICVNLTDSDFDTLKEFVSDTEEKLEELTKEHKIELKELAPSNKKLTRDEIIQLLVNEVIALKKQKTSSASSLNCDIDWKPIQDCGSCDKTPCDNLQTLVNKVGELLDN